MSELTVAAERMSKAKAGLILEHPFFAAIICGMEMIPDPDLTTLPVPTLGTDGRKVWYYPPFIASLELEQAKWALCHEVGHVMWKHMFRRGERDPKLWNIAGDYIINQLLEDERVGKRVTQVKVFFDPQMVERGGGTTEGVYDLLQQECQGGGGGAGGDEQFDACMDPSGSAADVSEAEAHVQVAIAQAAQAAKMCGKLSQKLERFIDAVMQPKVDWRYVLRRFVTQRAKIDYTWSRPKRRFIADDIWLPSMNGQTMGEIVVAIDESGSVSMEELQMFASEVAAIKDDTRPTRLHVVYWHSIVSHVDTFEQDDELEVKSHGSGGTIPRVIFEKVHEMGIDPACLVVLTDLYANDFGPEPGYPVLWVSTAADKAPWGEVVLMSNKL